MKISFCSNQVPVKREGWRRKKIPAPASTLRLTDDGAVHAIGIKAPRTISSAVNDVQYLRRGARYAQAVLVHIVGGRMSRRNVQAVDRRADDPVVDARKTNRSRVLCLSRQDGARRSKISL